MMWCSVDWCGVDWCGVVWRAVVWCGVVWCGLVWCDNLEKASNIFNLIVPYCQVDDAACIDWPPALASQV